MSLNEYLNSLSKNNEIAQRIISKIKDIDSFNWGYDPVHYMAIENSYGSKNDGIAPIREFRQAVSALQSMGFVISIDVVFNPTYASGLNYYSVLDKAVLDIITDEIKSVETFSKVVVARILHLKIYDGKVNCEHPCSLQRKFWNTVF